MGVYRKECVVGWVPELVGRWCGEMARLLGVWGWSFGVGRGVLAILGGFGARHGECKNSGLCLNVVVKIGVWRWSI